MRSAIDRKFKKGDIRDDGMIFWKYAKNKEQWMTPEKFKKTNDAYLLNIKEWRIKNKEHRKLYWKEYVSKNKEKVKENQSKYHKIYREKNKTELKQYFYKWYLENKAIHRQYSNEYEKNRKKIDPLFRLQKTIRHRISSAIRSKGYTKRSRSFEILGCSWEFVKQHIEKQFKDGMTWCNHGKWHIDHIIPLASASSENELLKLNHYSNLQPLWAEENLKKSNIITSK
jgi:hypothetical protein